MDYIRTASEGLGYSSIIDVDILHRGGAFCRRKQEAVKGCGVLLQQGEKNNVLLQIIRLVKTALAYVHRGNGSPCNRNSLR